MDSSSQSFVHIERRFEAGFLHFFRGKKRLSTEFLHANGTNRISPAGDKCQKVKAKTTTESNPIWQPNWRKFLAQSPFKTVDQVIQSTNTKQKTARNLLKKKVNAYEIWLFLSLNTHWMEGGIHHYIFLCYCLDESGLEKAITFSDQDSCLFLRD